jgi:tRNA G10  N-methylase Trm11
MNLQFYLEKLHTSEIFKKFMKENPDAFLCSGFFIIDKQGNDNKQHFDYYVPNIRKMFSFKMESGIEKVPVEMFEKKISEKVLINYDFDFKDIEKMILNEMEKQNIRSKIQKILLSLQKFDGKDFLIGTVFISALGMLKINIDLQNMKITDFEKKSFFNIMKIIKKK